jgi:hypothetical protein
MGCSNDVSPSVADRGCLSRILIFTHPGSRIPDPKTATKERGEKKIVVITFFVATNFAKFNIILFLKCQTKKCGPIFQRIIEVFTQKIVMKALKNMGLGSGIRKKSIPDPGSRGQKGTGSQIRIRNTGSTGYQKKKKKRLVLKREKINSAVFFVQYLVPLPVPE